MMTKTLVTSFLSVLMVNATMIPVLANPVNTLKDDAQSALTQETEYFVVLPEGKELSAQEMEKVEGEVLWKVAAVAAVAALGGVGVNAYQNVQAGRPWHQNWGSSAFAGAGAASCGMATFRGGGLNCGQILGTFWSNRRNLGW